MIFHDKEGTKTEYHSGKITACRSRGLFGLLLLLSCTLLAACGDSSPSGQSSAMSEQSTSADLEIVDLVYESSMELHYADQFAVDYYQGGYSLVTVQDGLQYLIVPEGQVVPDGETIRQAAEVAATDHNVKAGLATPPAIIQLPLHGIYQAASSAMDLFREIGALELVKLTGTKLSDWTIPEIHDLVENGTIAYGGKYNAPDYEMILTKGCDLAIESTMIYHNPEAKEKLEELGMPVLVERSSYEKHPLGRVEWIRLYGLLCGKEAEAESFMEDCQKRLEAVTESVSANLGQPESSHQPQVAFFYISSNGTANVRKPGDYISRMITMAGGDYIYADLTADENALSTMNLQMETFYEKTVDADILIYNSTVGEEIHTVQELLDKEPLLADFKAVKEGKVWCTGQNMYQETTGAVGMVEDFHAIMQGEEGAELTYLHHIDN